MTIQKYCMWNFSLLISKQWLLRLHFSYFLIKLFFFQRLTPQRAECLRRGLRSWIPFWTWKVWVYIFSFVSAWVCFLHNKSLGKPWQIAKNIPSGQKSQGSISWFQCTQRDPAAAAAGALAPGFQGGCTCWGPLRAQPWASPDGSEPKEVPRGCAKSLQGPRLVGCGLEHREAVPGVPALGRVLQLGEFKVLLTQTVVGFRVNCSRIPCCVSWCWWGQWTGSGGGSTGAAGPVQVLPCFIQIPDLLENRTVLDQQTSLLLK